MATLTTSRIYLVTGNTGEYGDRSEWTVKAFKDKAKAEEFVNKANSIAKELFEQTNNGMYFWNRELKHELDPRFTMDYTGTYYRLEEVSLE